jgi:type I restriction enzyme M protein
MTVLRRFDCVLEPTKARVIADYQRLSGRLDGEALDAALNNAAGQRFHNHSGLDFERLKGVPDNVAQHLVDRTYDHVDQLSVRVRRPRTNVSGK